MAALYNIGVTVDMGVIPPKVKAPFKLSTFAISVDTKRKSLSQESLAEVGSQTTNLGTLFRGNNSISGNHTLASLGLNYFTKLTSMQGMFADNKRLISLDLDGIDTKLVTSFMQMFSACLNLQSLKLNSVDTSSINDSVWLVQMFLNCNALSSLEVSTNFFNTAIRATSPVLAMNLSLPLWINLTQITNMLNALPNLIPLSRTATLTLSTNTKAVITANNLGSIASTKGWTIV